MRVLGIETSCDETAVAIYDSASGILAHELFSQVALHAPYGGVVPELASRDHIKKLLPLIQQVLEKSQLTPKAIDAIAFTQGPGLIGALLVGAVLARALAFAWGIPSIGVHHLEAHLLAPMLEEQRPTFPFLALLVSGGHTLLLSAKAFGEYEILGETLDDAAGEAFDKIAKALGLGYPGGPEIAKLAEKGDASRFSLPHPMTEKPGLDMSFSGLKTAACQLIDANRPLSPKTQADIAACFEMAIVETLAIKCRRALLQTGYSQLVVAGGVGANQNLRARLNALAATEGAQLFFPRPEYCTDNGAMVAYAGYERLKAGFTTPPDAEVKARWALDSNK